MQPLDAGLVLVRVGVELDISSSLIREIWMRIPQHQTQVDENLDVIHTRKSPAVIGTDLYGILAVREADRKRPGSARVLDVVSTSDLNTPLVRLVPCAPLVTPWRELGSHATFSLDNTLVAVTHYRPFDMAVIVFDVRTGLEIKHLRVGITSTTDQDQICFGRTKLYFVDNSVGHPCVVAWPLDTWIRETADPDTIAESRCLNLSRLARTCWLDSAQAGGLDAPLRITYSSPSQLHLAARGHSSWFQCVQFTAHYRADLGVAYVAVKHADRCTVYEWHITLDQVWKVASLCDMPAEIAVSQSGTWLVLAGSHLSASTDARWSKNSTEQPRWASNAG